MGTIYLKIILYFNNNIVKKSAGILFVIDREEQILKVNYLQNWKIKKGR
jgi:hypothetical protein